MKSASAYHALKQLLALSEAQQQLTQAVQAALPDTLRPHLLGTALEGNRLVLLTDQATWGSRLHYMAPQLLAAVHQHWPHLALQQVKVRVIQLPQPTTWRRQAKLTADETHIAQMAATAAMLRHENVRQRLQRLSEKLKQRLK
ncbi:MAG TPA: DUF721 domain-containing protein [Piscirickettsiaceae bacterium]|nr:DUF721 domain-containing protein [Piscirickettsiaceae bacterium]HIQ40939.1 DUF721 domain-containing protein [Sulfurivirga caldicuralii]